MFVKKLNVSDDVRAIILDRMEWSEIDGKTVGRIVTQLDRPTYVAVNKILEALGGKWDKRKQFRGHVFDTDPRPDLAPLEEGKGLEIEQYDYFPTPMDVVERMLNEAAPWMGNGRELLEPSAGDGRILKRALYRWPWSRVWWCELNARALPALLAWTEDNPGAEELGTDFLEVEPEAIYDAVVMNPPFSRNQWEKHLLHAWKFVKPGCVLVSVLPNSPRVNNIIHATDLGTERFAKIDLPEGTFKGAGTGVKTVIVVLVKEGISTYEQGALL